MEVHNREHNSVHHFRVDSSGRVVLPASFRSRQHIHNGDLITIIESDDGLVLKTRQQAIQQAQALFAELAPRDVRLSDELIRDRREEASRE